MPMKCVGGGTGYCIELVNGKEVYHKEFDHQLPEDIEHQYPDYLLYEIKDTAYGFLTRGCPRGCDFCHVKDKEGRTSYKVADLSEFWRGQKNIELLDPNMFACKDWKELAEQLIASNAVINMNQGVDIRILNDEKMEMIKQMKLSQIHFAWDRYQDKGIIVPKMKAFKEITDCDMRKTTVYVLTNFDTTFEQDLERIYTIRECGMTPYVMIYDKAHAPQKIKHLQRWVNNRFVFRSCERFEDYDPRKA